MINFTQAFDSAWERMAVILFRPFDIGKWFAIGLSAFLAGFLQGGNGFNGSFNTNNFPSSWNKGAGGTTSQFQLHQFNTRLHDAFSGLQFGVIIFIAVAFMLFVFALVLVLYWLGARGQFMLLDNVVRNRGAISWPWQYYARQANSLFFFYLLVMLLSLFLILPIVIVAVVMVIPLFQQQRWPEGGEFIAFIFLGLCYFAVAITLACVIFIFREFGIPIMFRNGLTAREAFTEAMGLVRQHPGSIAVFILLRIALAIAAMILAVIACCATCCIGALPYLGTVVLLPAIVYLRCFSLDCLAQFGPRYDVWTVDVPAADPAVPPPGGTPAWP